MRVLVVRIASVCCAVMSLASCGAPPLTVFTLSAPVTAVNAAPAGHSRLVIAVARVSIPDALDTEDIVLRDDGNILRRSRSGRWASRLSLGITDRLTQRLAERRPDALVTDRPLNDAASLRVLVNIERLEVTAAGVGTLDADWLVTRHDAGAAPVPVRGHFSATGPVGSDRDVVTLVGHLVDRLAAAINIGRG